MPSAFAPSATRVPIAPRPITPRVLPRISGPAKALLPFSTSLPTASPSPLRVLHQSTAEATFLDARKREQITSSLTAFAFAPGVLNTATPCAPKSATGILLTPAPALPMARVAGERVISCIEAERTRIASGASTESEQVYLAGSSLSRPTFEILLSVRILNIVIPPLSSSSQTRS